MKKNHEKDINGLQNQIAKAGLTVELDTPSKIMVDLRAQYDELAQKILEELDMPSRLRRPLRQDLLRRHSQPETYSPVLGDRPGLYEKSEGQLGEELEGGGGMLCHADGTAQWDPTAPGVRAGPDLGRGVAPDSGV